MAQLGPTPTTTYVFDVPTIMCEGCQTAITNHLRTKPYVRDVDVNVATQTATVSVTAGTLAQTIIDDISKTPKSRHEASLHEDKDNRKRTRPK